MRERASRLWTDGRLAPGCFEEEIVIVRGRRPAGGATLNERERCPEEPASASLGL
jgi:hypothetical protein